MNNPRRKRIAKIIETIENLKEELKSIKDDEQEALDNIPDGFRETDRYCAMVEAVDNLDYAYDSFDDVINYLEEAAS